MESERKLHHILFIIEDKEIGKVDSPEDTLLVCDNEEQAQVYAEEGYAVLGYAKNGGHFTGLPYIIEEIEDVPEEYYERVFRRLKGIPWTILETERCIVREITVEDVDRLYELYADPSVTQYMESLFPTMEQEREYTRQYIRNIYELYEFGMWVIERKEDHLLIGRAGVEQNEGMEGLELGFMLGVAYQHQGYAYEVCTAIMQYAYEELGVATLTLAARPENTASVRLIERLGFKPAGKIEKAGLTYAKYERVK